MWTIFNFFTNLKFSCTMTEVPLSPLQGVFLGVSTLKRLFQHLALHLPSRIKSVAELFVYEHKLFLKK